MYLGFKAAASLQRRTEALRRQSNGRRKRKRIAPAMDGHEETMTCDDMVQATAEGFKREAYESSNK